MMPTHKLVPAFCILFLLGTTSGCSLTRVSDTTHAEEVANLNVTGMRLDDAREKVRRQGYECNEQGMLRHVQTEHGSRPLIQLECSRSSSELFCPQIRNVVLNADPQTQTVVDVGQYITQRACF